MKTPSLNIDIINSELKQVLAVLQGVSRYIKSIFIEEKLIENEGIEVINFLNERYPTKKIVVNLSKKTEKDHFIEEIIAKTKIDFFIIKGDLTSSKFKALYKFLRQKKKKVIFASDEVNFALLKKYKFDSFFFFKAEKKENETHWTAQNLKNVKLLAESNFSLIVGNVTSNSVDQFKAISVDEFVIGEEICYSFNPVETCKLIYSNIKRG